MGCIHDKVETLRVALVECVNEKGFMHQDSIRLSEELDQFIARQQKDNMDKPKE
jgi:hypothetical protein